MYPIKYTGRPAWMQELIDQEQLERRNAQEREALEALAAIRNREERVHRPEEHTSDDDNEEDRLCWERQEAARAAEMADFRMNAEPTTPQHPQHPQHPQLEKQEEQPEPPDQS